MFILLAIQQRKGYLKNAQPFGGEVGQQVVAGGRLAGAHHPANQPGVDERAQPNATRDLVHFAADVGKQGQVDQHCPGGDECNGRCVAHAVVAPIVQIKRGGGPLLFAMPAPGAVYSSAPFVLMTFWYQ